MNYVHLYIHDIMVGYFYIFPKQFVSLSTV